MPRVHHIKKARKDNPCCKKGELQRPNYVFLCTELRIVLDALPEPAWELTKIGEQHIGLTCQILGPNGSFTQNLSWANIAKLIGNDYSARGEYQITDAGTHGRDWGTKWYTHGPNTGEICWGSYGRDTMLSVQIIDNDDFDNSTCHLSEEAAR